MNDALEPKTITLTIYPETFVELEFKSQAKKLNLSEIYTKAIENYLSKDISLGRLKVYGAPSSGKRIRLIVSLNLHNQLFKKAVISGAKLNDVVYTALELYLDKNLFESAA